MIKKILPFLLLIAACSNPNKEEKNILLLFNNYKKALHEADGNTTSNYVDTKSIQYYDDLLTKIKSADSATVVKLPVMDKLTIFAVREQLSREDIVNMNGKDLLIYSINSGLLSQNDSLATSLENIKINADNAEADFVTNGQKPLFKFKFIKEKGEWKISLLSFLPTLSELLSKMIAESGNDENIYLLSILEMTSGKKISENVWYPVQ